VDDHRWAASQNRWYPRNTRFLNEPASTITGGGLVHLKVVPGLEYLECSAVVQSLDGIVYGKGDGAEVEGRCWNLFAGGEAQPRFHLVSVWHGAWCLLALLFSHRKILYAWIEDIYFNAELAGEKVGSSMKELFIAGEVGVTEVGGDRHARHHDNVGVYKADIH